MTEEFNLSEKIFEDRLTNPILWTEDVKEFIKILKKNLKNYGKDKQYREKIDKLAGDDLNA